MKNRQDRCGDLVINFHFKLNAIKLILASYKQLDR